MADAVNAPARPTPLTPERIRTALPTVWRVAATGRGAFMSRAYLVRSTAKRPPRPGPAGSTGGPRARVRGDSRPAGARRRRDRGAAVPDGVAGGWLWTRAEGDGSAPSQPNEPRPVATRLRCNLLKPGRNYAAAWCSADVALFHPIDACDDGAAVAVAVADNAVPSRDVDRGRAAGWEREGRMTDDERDDEDDDRDEDEDDDDEEEEEEDVLRC